MLSILVTTLVLRQTLKIPSLKKPGRVTKSYAEFRPGEVIKHTSCSLVYYTTLLYLWCKQFHY